MKASDIVKERCVCGSYDFEPFPSYAVGEIIHCSECDAYNRGRGDQAEISFKAGIKEVVGWVELIEKGEPSSMSWSFRQRWQSKLKEWEC